MILKHIFLIYNPISSAESKIKSTLYFREQFYIVLNIMTDLLAGHKGVEVKRE
jgi:hypothetical protein